MCSQSLSEVIKIIDFTDTETRYCGDYHYTVYKIQVESDIFVNNVLSETNTSTIYKRYSDFVEFDKLLTSEGIRTPKLPGKKFFSTMSAKTIEDRRQKLSKFLNSVLLTKDKTVHNRLQDFLKESDNLNTARTRKSSYLRRSVITL